MDVVSSFFAAINKMPDGSQAAQDMITFIRARYADPVLSVQCVSDYVYLGCIYTCQIFKLRMGKTINVFLTETRIEEAIRFMNFQ